jgi:hypothetical protein
MALKRAIALGMESESVECSYEDFIAGIEDEPPLP